MEGWMVSGWKERKTDRYWTDIWNGEWERREFLWTGSQIPALPKPLGLGKFPKADPRPGGTGKGRAGNEASANRSGRFSLGTGPWGPQEKRLRAPFGSFLCPAQCQGQNHQAPALSPDRGISRQPGLQDVSSFTC